MSYGLTSHTSCPLPTVLQLFDDLFGRAAPKPKAMTAIPAINQYAKFPPMICFSIPNAKAEFIADGPTARTMATIICAKPDTAPIEARLGAAELTYTNVAPGVERNMSIDFEPHRRMAYQRKDVHMKTRISERQEEAKQDCLTLALGQHDS